MDLLKKAEMQIIRGRMVILPDRLLEEDFKTPPAYFVNECNEKIMLNLRDMLKIIKDIKYFDLWDTQK